MTTGLFTLLVSAHIKDSPETDSSSLMLMWKWCTAICQMAWLWNFAITLIFWTMLFPFSTGKSGVFTYVDHILPFVLTTIDWSLTNMLYSSSAMLLNIGVVLVYGAVNIIVTYVTGKPVYPPFITWDSLLSWVIGLALIPLFIGIFYLELWFNNLKINKLKTMDLPTKKEETRDQHLFESTKVNYSN